MKTSYGNLDVALQMSSVLRRVSLPSLVPLKQPHIDIGLGKGSDEAPNRKIVQSVATKSPASSSLLSPSNTLIAASSREGVMSTQLSRESPGQSQESTPSANKRRRIGLACNACRMRKSRYVITLG